MHEDLRMMAQGLAEEWEIEMLELNSRTETGTEHCLSYDYPKCLARAQNNRMLNRMYGKRRRR